MCGGEDQADSLGYIVSQDVQDLFVYKGWIRSVRGLSVVVSVSMATNANLGH